MPNGGQDSCRSLRIITNSGFLSGWTPATADGKDREAMRSRYIIAVLAAVILLVGLLAGYGIYVNVSSGSHVEKLAASQYARVAGSRAGYREAASVLEVPVLYLQSAWMLDVHVKLEGTIAKLYVNPGDSVKAGQLIGEIVNDELPAQILQAEGKINEARANLVKYENTLKRYQALVEAAGVSKQQLDEAIANHAAGEAMLQTAEASKTQLLSRQTAQSIVAPRDGDILKVYSREGAFIRGGEALVMIGDFSSLLARENLRQEVLEKILPTESGFRLVLPENQPVSKAYDANYHQEKMADGMSFAIRLQQVTPPLNVPAPYRSVVWQVDNAGGILEPGTYYRAKIYGTQKRRILAIPRQAVSGRTESQVLVVAPDGRLTEKKIVTGIHDDAYVEVLEGLQEGEIVALTGQGLRSGARVQAILDAPAEPNAK